MSNRLQGSPRSPERPVSRPFLSVSPRKENSGVSEAPTSPTRRNRNNLPVQSTSSRKRGHTLTAAQNEHGRPPPITPLAYSKDFEQAAALTRSKPSSVQFNPIGPSFYPSRQSSSSTTAQSRRNPPHLPVPPALITPNGQPTARHPPPPPLQSFSSSPFRVSVPPSTPVPPPTPLPATTSYSEASVQTEPLNPEPSSEASPRLIDVCATCSGSVFEKIDGATRYHRLHDLDSAAVILNTLARQDITLGRFLSIILDPENLGSMNRTNRTKLLNFLQGQNPGSHPVDIAQAMANHKYARDKPSTSASEEDVLTFPFPFPSYSVPPPSSSVSSNTLQAALQNVADYAEMSFYKVPASRALRNYAVHETLIVIEKEMESLVQADELRTSGAGDGAFSWKFILNFSFVSLLHVILLEAPILWTIMTTASVGERRGATLKKVREEARGGGGRGSNNFRDPWLVSNF